MKKVLLLLIMVLSGVLMFVLQPHKSNDNKILSSASVKDFSENELKKKTDEQKPANETILLKVKNPTLNEKDNTELTETVNQNKPSIKQQTYGEQTEKITLEKHHLLLKKSIARYESNLLDLEAKQQLKTELSNATDYRKMMLQSAKEQMEKTARNK